MATVNYEILSLSDSVKVLLNELASCLIYKLTNAKKIEFLFLEILPETLKDLHSVLGYVAEEEQIITDPTYNNLSNTLTYVVFQVGNTFEEINLFLHHRTPYPTAQVLKNLSSRLELFYKLIDSKTIKLIKRIEVLSSGEQLGVSHETPTSSILVDDSFIYGRDGDKEKLKHLLLSSDGHNGKIRVISIVGMGGIGKTTLAKLIYNDPQVKDKFQVREWAHVSKDLDTLGVFETIFQSINIHKSDVNTVHPNFLLVLDDVFNARSVNWTLIMDIFNAEKTGSLIIITTRDEKVPKSMQNFFFIHCMKPLQSEDCWSLLAKHAFGECYYQPLEEIGREIAKKCDGLPLAAVALGDLLRNKFFRDKWNYVLESDNWKSLGYEVQATIESSYHYLSDPLKRCFAYCSIFPKKSILEKKTVVQLWIAEGLVTSSKDQASLKKVGEKYFDRLVSRSLIQRRSVDGEEESFEMHNLVHDLATMVSFPYCMGLDEHHLLEVHYFSYNRGLYDSFNFFSKLGRFKDIRTFLALPLQEQSPLCLLSNKLVHDLLPTMIQLRTLSLSNYKSITEIPNSIGNLLYLRYLNLSHTSIERLPSETCKLYELQFLLLAGCRRLIELPEDIGKLVNLCHLDVRDTALREMPVQITKLLKLQTLSDFVVSRHNDGLRLAELGKFPHLFGKLSISQLQNVNDPYEADQANMKRKQKMEKLALEWDCGGTSSDSEIQRDVLEHLRPSTNLKSLTIKGYGGINFPNWLGDFLYRNMVYLSIANCDNCLWLPPLGYLTNLKELIIKGMQSVQTIGTEFYGSDGSPSFQPFPSLEILHFEDMQECEEWNLIGGTTEEFPSLQNLSITNCPKLRIGKIPDKFRSLSELDLRECPLLVQSFPSLVHVFSELMFPFNSLRQLTIDGFPSSMSFPKDGLPKTLKFLIISNCENLEFLPHEYLYNYTSLEELKISYSCNSMISFTLGALPVLKSLFIEGCKNLKSILIAEEWSQKSLPFLRSIKIWDCNELESFPPGGFPTPNLVYIAVWKCEKLRALPEAMSSLSGLQEMEIDNLPNLQSFVIDDLPIGLQELTVGSVGGIMWNTEPTWEHLPRLSVLKINGDDIVNKMMKPLLPTSLVTLRICGLNDKRIDGKWLQHLSSLRYLEIVNATKLKLLPKKGLPSSLCVLSITHCPLLVAKLRRKRGKEWRKISHIPSIIINDELIT